MRYLMRIAYDGVGFHGWQRQPADVSVQQTIEEALTKLLRSETSGVGAGRTDTGVSAREMFAHFDSDLPEEYVISLVKALDNMAGRNVSVYEIRRVNDDFHARFDARRRTYKYFVAVGKSPFGSHVWKSPKALDFDRMNEAAALLLQIDDFTSFAKLHSDARTTICRVRRAVWTRVDGVPGAWYFEITADRFLRNMVRAVVGTLVEVGRGKLSFDGFRRVVEARDRCAAGTSMPPQALYLWDVGYPYFDASTATYTPII